MLTAKIGDNSPIISFPAAWNFLYHRTAKIINFFTRRFSIRLLYAVRFNFAAVSTKVDRFRRKKVLLASTAVHNHSSPLTRQSREINEVTVFTVSACVIRYFSHSGHGVTYYLHRIYTEKESIIVIIIIIVVIVVMPQEQQTIYTNKK